LWWGFGGIDKKKRGKEGYDRGSHPDLGFTAYDSIHGIIINTKSK